MCIIFRNSGRNWCTCCHCCPAACVRVSVEYFWLHMLCLSLGLYFLFCCQAASAHDTYLRDVPTHTAHMPSAPPPPRPAPRAPRAQSTRHLARKSVKKAVRSPRQAPVGLYSRALGTIFVRCTLLGMGRTHLQLPLYVCVPPPRSSKYGRACGAPVIDTKRMCRYAVTASHRVGPPSRVKFVPLHRERCA